MGNSSINRSNANSRRKGRLASWWHIPILIIAGLIDLPYGIAVKAFDLVWRPELPRLANTRRRRARGLTLVLGGIEGPSIYNYQIVCGVLRSGYRGSVVRFDWNAGIPFWRSLVNLMSPRHHDRKSTELVELVCDYRRAHPKAPINLIAQSGGCWIVIRALERLPNEFRIHTALLLAPAVSPGYDASKASRFCSIGLISIGSPGDFVFLGLGTLLLGTSDRVFTLSAGLVGWRKTATNLLEWRWRPAWLRYGYIGNHTTSGILSFLAHVIGPVLAYARCPKAEAGLVLA